MRAQCILPSGITKVGQGQIYYPTVGLYSNDKKMIEKWTSLQFCKDFCLRSSALASKKRSDQKKYRHSISLIHSAEKSTYYRQPLSV